MVGKDVLIYNLSLATSISLEKARLLLEDCGWNYEWALAHFKEEDKNMTMEDKIELILLNSVLDDRFYCNQLRHETLGKLLVRHRVLLDEFVKQYELPNSNNGPLQEP